MLVMGIIVFIYLTLETTVTFSHCKKTLKLGYNQDKLVSNNRDTVKMIRVFNDMYTVKTKKMINSCNCGQQR